MPEDATFREGMLPSELETKKVALAPEVCRQFLLRKQYILSQIHLHSSVTVYVRMAMRSMLFIVQDVSHDGIPQHLHQMAASPFHSQFGGDSPPPNGDAEKVDDILLLVWRLPLAFPPLADDTRSQPRCTFSFNSSISYGY